MLGLKQRSVALAIGMGSSLLFSSQMAFASGAWYIGLGGGASKLNPDTTTSAFMLEEEQGSAAGIYLGLDINDWLSAEAAYTDLGEAGLSNDQYIGYTAISVGGVAYVYRNRGMDSRQSGLSGYLRLGLNSVTNESNIQLNEADNTAVWMGAGVQYPLSDRFGLRAEVASFDGDAQVALASVYWRSRDDGSTGGFTAGSSTEGSTSSSTRRDDQFGNDDFGETDEFDSFDVDGEVANADFEDATDLVLDDPFESDTFDGNDPFETDALDGNDPFESDTFDGNDPFETDALDGNDPFETDTVDGNDPFETELLDGNDPFETLDADPGLDGFPVASSTECNEPAVGEPTDAAGCAMFTGVFEGIEFEGDTAILSIDAGFLLQNLAMSMNDYPRLVIELQVHTQNYAEPGRAMELSRERVLAIARFLASQGVDVQRLKARAFGSEDPRFDDASPESQRLNNRLALRVM
ncbi:MAG: OmpA family protein [Granulosicoccus sp.]